MGEQEAKHLAALIEREPGSWITVVGIQYNELFGHYAVKCDDLTRGFFVMIETPRQ